MNKIVIITSTSRTNIPKNEPKTDPRLQPEGLATVELRVNASPAFRAANLVAWNWEKGQHSRPPRFQIAWQLREKWRAIPSVSPECILKVGGGDGVTTVVFDNKSALRNLMTWESSLNSAHFNSAWTPFARSIAKTYFQSGVD